MPATVPPEIAKALQDGDPPPPKLSALGYSLADSPAGLAAWFYDKFADWTYSGGDPERSLTKGHGTGSTRLDIDGQGNGTVTQQRLYQLIRQPGPVTEHTFEITFLDPGAAPVRSPSARSPSRTCADAGHNLPGNTPKRSTQAVLDLAACDGSVPNPGSG
jgi:hypothetical protein